MSDLVGNPGDQFSRDVAQLVACQIGNKSDLAIRHSRACPKLSVLFLSVILKVICPSCRKQYSPIVDILEFRNHIYRNEGESPFINPKISVTFAQK